ncbi:MAG: hypothetical protein Q4E53_02010 [Eubacteriales bacterium]|nr:hypothetical protein [Eubacteriales bacterium]
MAEGQSFFQKVLGNFTHEFANGDIIRKYADQGYSIKEMRKKLDFPSPFDKIHEIVWKHFLDSQKILLEKPGENRQMRYQYVKDVSAYGKVSFRRIQVENQDNDRGDIIYNEMTIDEAIAAHCFELFSKNNIYYVEIPFGLIRYRDQKAYEQLLNNLSDIDADYVDGLFKERRLVYYKIDQKMARIICKLYNVGAYQGKVYHAILHD